MEEEHSVVLFGSTFIVVVFTGHQVSVCPQERGARETKHKGRMRRHIVGRERLIGKKSPAGEPH